MSVKGVATVAISTGLIILSIVLIAQTAVANALVTLTPNDTIHPSETLVWINWNCYYDSPQPCVVDKTYFIIGGIKWVIDSSGAVNISMDRYTPEDLYHNGGIGFNFTATPSLPCKISFEIVGVPRGDYIIHRITSSSEENITAHGSDLKFSDYITQPTTYVVQMENYKGAPSIIPKIPIPTPNVVGKKHATPSFEAIFAIAGLVATAYLLNRRNI